MCLGGRSQALLLPIMICSSLNYTGRTKPNSASARANLQVVKVQTGRPPGDNIGVMYVVQVETWISASGKHGYTRDWLACPRLQDRRNSPASNQPLWNDLDINQHVNHIKYISWILEGAPRSFLESHKLSAMTLEYRKECGRESMLHNLSAVSRNGTSATNTDHFTEDEGIDQFDHSLYLQDGSEVLRA